MLRSNVGAASMHVGINDNLDFTLKSIDNSTRELVESFQKEFDTFANKDFPTSLLENYGQTSYEFKKIYQPILNNIKNIVLPNTTPIKQTIANLNSITLRENNWRSTDYEKNWNEKLAQLVLLLIKQQQLKNDLIELKQSFFEKTKDIENSLKTFKKFVENFNESLGKFIFDPNINNDVKVAFDQDIDFLLIPVITKQNKLQQHINGIKEKALKNKKELANKIDAFNLAFDTDNEIFQEKISELEQKRKNLISGQDNFSKADIDKKRNDLAQYIKEVKKEQENFQKLQLERDQLSERIRNDAKNIDANEIIGVSADSLTVTNKLRFPKVSALIASQEDSLDEYLKKLNFSYADFLSNVDNSIKILIGMCTDIERKINNYLNEMEKHDIQTLQVLFNSVLQVLTSSQQIFSNLRLGNAQKTIDEVYKEADHLYEDQQSKSNWNEQKATINKAVLTHASLKLKTETNSIATAFEEEKQKIANEIQLINLGALVNQKKLDELKLQINNLQTVEVGVVLKEPLENFLNAKEEILKNKKNSLMKINSTVEHMLKIQFPILEQFIPNIFAPGTSPKKHKYKTEIDNLKQAFTNIKQALDEDIQKFDNLKLDDLDDKTTHYQNSVNDLKSRVEKFSQKTTKRNEKLKNLKLEPSLEPQRRDANDDNKDDNSHGPITAPQVSSENSTLRETVSLALTDEQKQLLAWKEKIKALGHELINEVKELQSSFLNCLYGRKINLKMQKIDALRDLYDAMDRKDAMGRKVIENLADLKTAVNIELQNKDVTSGWTSRTDRLLREISSGVNPLAPDHTYATNPWRSRAIKK